MVHVAFHFRFTTNLNFSPPVDRLGDNYYWINKHSFQSHKNMKMNYSHRKKVLFIPIFNWIKTRIQIILFAFFFIIINATTSRFFCFYFYTCNENLIGTFSPAGNFFIPFSFILNRTSQIWKSSWEPKRGKNLLSNRHVCFLQKKEKSLWKASRLSECTTQ
jgi:hypothetical protein